MKVCGLKKACKFIEYLLYVFEMCLTEIGQSVKICIDL